MRVVSERRGNQHTTITIQLQIAGVTQYQSLKSLYGGVQCRQCLYVSLNALPLGQGIHHHRLVELAAIARKDGMMALEGQDVPDKFFEKGMQLLVDGADEAKMVKIMNAEIAAMKSRHEVNHGILSAWIDIAPAMGMIGTLVGLVVMLGNMSDPKAIGPAMAVALLTTLYGAFFANVFFGPIRTKLEGYTAYEIFYRGVVLEGLRNIARGESPRNIQDVLASNLPSKQQEKLAAA